MRISDPAVSDARWAPQTITAAAWAAVMFVLFAGFMVTGLPGSRSVEVVGSVTSVVVTSVAAVFAGLAGRSVDGRVRAAWTALALGLTAATVAEVLWARGHLLQQPLAFPSAADVAYLMFPLGVLAALLLFPGGRGRPSPGRLVLDGVIMGGSVLIVSWLTVMRPVYIAGDEGWPALLAALAYPASNVVTLTVATVVLARSGVAARPTLTLLALGLLALTVAESIFAYLSVDQGPLSGRHLIEVGWTAGIVLIALAGIQGRYSVFGEPSHAPPGWASVWLPYAPLMLATVVMALEPGHLFDDGLVLLCLAILVPAVLLRQFLAVAENRRLVGAVVDLAMRDPLTGLANRTLFDERLTAALGTQSAAGPDTVAVLILDLDGFKTVNDEHGHAVGDALLIGVADRLRARVGEGHTVARLGGDEFAVLLEGPPAEARRVSADVSAAFEDPFVIDGHTVAIGAGIGLEVARPGETTAETLLKHADLSMYAAKRSVAQRSSPDPADDGSALAELRAAIDEVQLRMVYQPKFALATGAVVGMEALLRWQHPDRGLLLPGQFLPTVRRHGLMEAINEVALRLTLDDVRRWKQDGLDVNVAVNMFAPTLADWNLPPRVVGMLTERGLSPTVLTLELTEDLPLGRIGPTKIVLGELRDHGVRISIDDFGAGYSALSYLMQLPVDEVKLDRGFLGPSLSAGRVESVVRMTVGMARELGLTTVAEGVSDRETFDRLAELGVDVGQGNFLGTPANADAVPGIYARSALPVPAVTTAPLR